MAAPAGLCEFCGGGLEWTFWKGEMWTSCPWCYDIFGTGLAGGSRREEGARRDEDNSIDKAGRLPASLHSIGGSSGHDAEG